MNKRSFLTVGLLLALAVWAISGARAEVLSVRPGEESDAGKLGYGWSYPEQRSDGAWFRWMEKREGEIHLTIVEPMDYQLAVELMPLVAHERIQHFGLYVNHRFVREWKLESLGRFQWFETALPEHLFREGTNTLILRAGYKESPDADPRTLSLAVKQVILTSHE
ncbi:MAG: hypothetical protein PHP44_07765 [Kiritimatiellae bacterium]|nr:hypothetical protein [Kiritimatiellia bacterium]